MLNIIETIVELARLLGSRLARLLRHALFAIPPSFDARRPPPPEPLRAEVLARSEIGRLLAAHKGRPIDK